MKIALLTDGLTPWVIGGMQRHSRMLAEHLTRQGVQLTVFHTAFGTGRDGAAAVGATDDRGFGARIQLCFVPYPRVGRLPGHYLREQAAYSRMLLDRYLALNSCPDFIYAQGLTSIAFLDYRDNGGKLPPIGVNCHGYNMFQVADSAWTMLQHLMMRSTFARVNQRSDCVFCFSGKIREIVEVRLGVPRARLIELPNAIDDTWLSDRPTSQARIRRFTFVGRYDRCKGLPEIHRAIRGLPPGPWHFRFIGPIPEARRLRHPCIEYVGAMREERDMQALLSDSDCLVCPSYSEGMPTVVLEAMARGNAIIATDVGATRELVDAANGLLLAKPTAAGIAGAMSEIISMNTDHLERLKETSLTRARRYAWSIVARRHVDAIEGFLASRQQPSRAN